MVTSTRPTRGTAKVMVMGMEAETETTWGQQRDKCQHAPQHKHNLQHFSKRIMTKHFLISKNETETETEPTTECLTVCKQDSHKNTLPHPHSHTHTDNSLAHPQTRPTEVKCSSPCCCSTRYYIICPIIPARTKATNELRIEHVSAIFVL